MIPSIGPHPGVIIEFFGPRDKPHPAMLELSRVPARCWARGSQVRRRPLGAAVLEASAVGAGAEIRCSSKCAVSRRDSLRTSGVVRASASYGFSIAFGTVCREIPSL